MNTTLLIIAEIIACFCLCFAFMILIDAFEVINNIRNDKKTISKKDWKKFFIEVLKSILFIIIGVLVLKLTLIYYLSNLIQIIKW